MVLFPGQTVYSWLLDMSDQLLHERLPDNRKSDCIVITIFSAFSSSDKKSPWLQKFLAMSANKIGFISVEHFEGDSEILEISSFKDGEIEFLVNLCKKVQISIHCIAMNEIVVKVAETYIPLIYPEIPQDIRESMSFCANLFN